MAASFTGLDRLLSNLRLANHDFKATTELFPQLDVEKIAKEMELAELGTSRGKDNLPPSEAESPDSTELAILERIDDAKGRSFNALEEQLLSFSRRMADLEFQSQFSVIEKSNAESLTNFKGRIVKGRAELHTLRNELRVADRDLATFQKKNNLDRGAISTAGSKQFLKIAILLVVFGVEWLFNGFFLAEGSRMGFVGGVIAAAVFAFLNVGVAFILTMFGIRNLVHRSFLRKVYGFVALIAWIAMALIINLLLAHYRELSGTTADGFGIGVEAWQRFMSDPIGLQDLNSWTLFAFGVLFSVLAMIDTLYMGDPYMGYEAVAKRRQEAEEAYKAQQSDEIDELISLRDEHHKKIDEIIDQMHSNRREHSSIVAHRAKTLSLFAEYQTHLERAANQLLSRYRDANIAARTTASPKHFNQSFKLERMTPSQAGTDEMTDKEVADAVRKAQADLSEQIKAISKACEDGIEQYRELDNLFPEEANGKA